MANPHPDVNKLKPHQFKKGDTSNKAVNGALGGAANAARIQKEKTVKMIVQQSWYAPVDENDKAHLATLGIPVREGMTKGQALMEYIGVQKYDPNTKFGDLIKLFETMAKYMGEEPAKELNVTGDISSKVKYIEPDEYKAVQDHINQVVGDTNDEPAD